MPTAVEMILRLEGINGQMDQKGSIAVLSFSFGVSQAERNQQGGGGGTGKATIGDLVIVKALDKASPSLFLACAKGTHLHKGEFAIVTTGETTDARPFALYQFTDVIVESVRQMGNEHAGIPTEEITLEFGRLDTFAVTGDGSV